jgi:hypothetical protein
VSISEYITIALPSHLREPQGLVRFLGRAVSSPAGAVAVYASNLTSCTLLMFYKHGCGRTGGRSGSGRQRC